MTEPQEPLPGRPAARPLEPTAPSPLVASIADGRDHSLDPRAVTVARLVGGISAAIVSAGALLAVLVASPALPFGPLTLTLGWFLISAGSGALSFFWPPLRHRHASYRVDGRGILIRRGVLWRSEVTVPKSRVQHTDVSHGPIERSFGLATLVVHTAGTEQASVALGGLTAEVANRIRDYLIEGGEDDAV